MFQSADTKKFTV